MIVYSKTFGDSEGREGKQSLAVYEPCFSIKGSIKANNATELRKWIRRNPKDRLNALPDFLTCVLVNLYKKQLFKREELSILLRRLCRDLLADNGYVESRLSELVKLPGEDVKTNLMLVT